MCFVPVRGGAECRRRCLILYVTELDALVVVASRRQASSPFWFAKLDMFVLLLPI